MLNNTKLRFKILRSVYRRSIRLITRRIGNSYETRIDGLIANISVHRTLYKGRDLEKAKQMFSYYRFTYLDGKS